MMLKCAICGPFEVDHDDFQVAVEQHMGGDSHQTMARLRNDLDAGVEPLDIDGLDSAGTVDE